MKKIIILAALLVIIVLILGLANTKNSSSEVKVGAILMLTGDLSEVGQEMQRGIDLAVNEINSAGGIEGKKIRVIYEYQGFMEKTKIVSAVQKMINIDKVDFIFLDTVEAVKPVAPILQESKTPTLVLWDDNNYLRTCGDYIVGTGFSTEKTGETMGEFMYGKGVRTMAIVSSIDEWAEIVSTSAKSKFENLGGKVVFFDRMSATETDFRAPLKKIKDNNISGIILPLIASSPVLFLKQAKELDVNVPMITGDGFNDSTLAAAGPTAEGLYFTNVYAEQNPILEKALAQYKKTYSNEPALSVFMALGYDGVLTIKQTVLESKNASKEANKNAVYTISNLPLSSGINLTINSRRENNRSEIVYKVENGKIIPAE